MKDTLPRAFRQTYLVIEILLLMNSIMQHERNMKTIDEQERLCLKDLSWQVLRRTQFSNSKTADANKMAGALVIHTR